MASKLLVVTFCTIVFSYNFGTIVGQSAVHLRQVAPWPPLADRGAVVREGDTLSLQCESDEEPASDSTIEALFQV